MVGQTISHYRITQKLGEGGQRTMIGALVAVLLLTAGQAMAQLTSEGNRFWSQDSDGIAGQAERGDDFGGALATGDFNNDGFEDLAIGVHGEDDGAGAVNVIYGGPAGLATPGNQFWHQDIPGILGEAERRGDGVLEFDPFGDNFGSALAAGDFNNDGFDDLAIGVSGEDIERILGDENAVGVVNVIYGGPAGLAAPGNQLWRQGRNGIEGGGEARDFFGTALAAGDFDNNGVDDLAIGVSGEDVGGIQNAGAVNVIYGGSGGLVASGNQIWHQDSDGIAGQAEGTDFFGDADRFGSALAAGDFDNDGFADLAIGVPGEDTDAGAVNVIYGGPEGLAPPGNQIWAQHSDDIVGGGPERATTLVERLPPVTSTAISSKT